MESGVFSFAEDPPVSIGKNERGTTPGSFTTISRLTDQTHKGCTGAFGTGTRSTLPEHALVRAVPLDMPGGTTTIALRGREPAGGTTKLLQLILLFFLHSIKLSKYPLAIMRKIEDNSGEYHTLNNP